MNPSAKIQQDTKRVFYNQGTCSRTLFYILNREFDHPMEAEEAASDVLAGGIALHGDQCGMLWGAALAAGAEAYRRAASPEEAVPVAILTTRALLDSFVQRAHTPNCREITGSNFNNRWSMAKYLLTGKFLGCFFLADKWAPEAIRTALDEFASKPEALPSTCRSCASEVARRMGASEEEAALVAGFAGGIGLSGNGCGALGAAVWLKTLRFCRENPGKPGFGFPGAKETLDAFLQATGGETRCETLSGQRFETLDEHTAFIENGGCKQWMEVLEGSGSEPN